MEVNDMCSFPSADLDSVTEIMQPSATAAAVTVSSFLRTLVEQELDSC